jgi:hypothetical protein
MEVEVEAFHAAELERVEAAIEELLSTERRHREHRGNL